MNRMLGLSHSSSKGDRSDSNATSGSSSMNEGSRTPPRPHQRKAGESNPPRTGSTHSQGQMHQHQQQHHQYQQQQQQQYAHSDDSAQRFNHIKPAPRYGRHTSAPESMDNSYYGGRIAGNYSGGGGVAPEFVLPTSWFVSNTMFQLPNPLCVAMPNVHGSATVLANRHVPTAYLQESAREMGSSNQSSSAGGSTEFWRSNRAEGRGIYPSLNSNGPLEQQHGSGYASSGCVVYYFEVQLPPRSGTASYAEVVIGFVVDPNSHAPLGGMLPGETAISVGWGLGGLKVNGVDQMYDNNQSVQGTPLHLNAGDTIGCGIEVMGMQRVFFTLNGSLVVQPSPTTSLEFHKESQCFPAVGFRNGGGETIKANFGLDPTNRFRWPGTERLVIAPCQQHAVSISTSVSSSYSQHHGGSSGFGGGGSSDHNAVSSGGGAASMSAHSSAANPMSRRSPSPYYAMDSYGNAMASSEFKAEEGGEHGGSPSRSASRSMHTSSQPSPTPASMTIRTGSSSNPPGTPPIMFGTPSRKGSLEAASPASGNAMTVTAMGGGQQPHPPLFGTKMSKRSSLEDDDPLQTNHAHFDLGRTGSATQASSLVATSASRRSSNDSNNSSSWQYHQQPPPPPPSTSSSSGVRASSSASPSAPGPSSTPSVKMRVQPRTVSLPPDGTPSSSREQRGRASEGVSPHHHQAQAGTQVEYDPARYQRVTRKEGDENRKKSPQRRAHAGGDTESASGTEHDESTQPGAVSVLAGGDILLIAKENYKTLLMACGKKRVDAHYVKDLVELCNSDADRLQRELEAKLTDESASDKIVNLLELISEINDAIETGKRAMKRVKDPPPKSKSSSSNSSSRPNKPQADGPTIELLVQNEDVFSLTCMLRAGSEKRLAAALALMRFAKNSDMLRDEIRSLGGMHSFLTLFRANGMTREIQVVASMAVAYLLPSFVASSQTSSSLGLKILECLRFLLISRPVHPQGNTIGRDEMCQACAYGINILWIHAIQPLLSSELANNSKREKRPSLRISASRSMRKLASRSGGGLFDQAQGSAEIKELTELAVTMITHIAKLTNGEKLNIDMGFNIVEQICEVDVARPIAVREGLLKILVDWIRSKDIERVRPAASALRYLISIKDLYMAGWIHSQVVNEGAVVEIVKLLENPVGHDVRVAVAQMLSALCVAPHTRAAVVEASCVSYLVAMLYEHIDPASEQMVQYAGSALLQLAAGAMTRSGGTSLAMIDSGSSDKQEAVVNEIVTAGAHGSFIEIAMTHGGKLRSIAVEALRVLSEDTNPKRDTRLYICSAGAAEALGKTLKDDLPDIEPLTDPDQYAASFSVNSIALVGSIKEIHAALVACANILDPPKQPSKSQQDQVLRSHFPNRADTLIGGCVDFAKSGGLESLIQISVLPYAPSPLSEMNLAEIDRMDLLEEACRLLASLSPLLLTETAASKGCARWASEVFDALDGILKRQAETEGGNVSDDFSELNVHALRGLGALARYEPLKIRIVSKTLPKLLLFKNLSGERADVSNAANQVLLSLGFTENEITVQVAGNNPTLLVDWFCLQRALVIQAMARAEIREELENIWRVPFGDSNHAGMKLIRQDTGLSTTRSASGSGDEDDFDTIKSLFDHFTTDADSSAQRKSLLAQYRDIYEIDSSGAAREISRMGSVATMRGNEDDGLISRHVYPLNETNTERDWILSHGRKMNSEAGSDIRQCSVDGTVERIDKLLECCFPSRLLRNSIIPIMDLRPESSFNFRALMMPQRRYFSFRREGQLLSRLCEKQAATLDSDDVHWTLGFTNSTFAGEFVESLVQTLYLCPMVTGLSFTRNSDWLAMRDGETENDGDDGGGLLANLAGSLPPWVSYLTFDNMLNDRDLLALITIIETMGRLSVQELDEEDNSSFLGPDNKEVGQTQGKFDNFGIRNCPQIAKESWNTFFKMLGRSGPKRGPTSTPLSSLTALDLSGNKLGDDACALVLELVHDKDSGCQLQQLDLSGNRIGRGTNVVKVLRAYTEYYRYNQTVGVKMGVRKSWKSSLHTLVLAENDLFLGQAGLEIFSLLKHNALCMRSVDLSNNSLEGDNYQLLASSLLKNTSLCHLNLSGNKFSSLLIDLILERLNSSDAESGLSFLRFDENEPALTESQRTGLNNFLRKSRKLAIERYMKERERRSMGDLHELQESDNFGHTGALDIVDESEASGHFSRRSFTAQHVDLDPEPEPEPGENMITVLFSAPLVFRDEGNRYHPFAKLDFDMERELLWQCMKEASRDIEVSFDNAHVSRLLASSTKRCSCLHYSGHGHQSFLPFEDGKGGPHWLSVEDIKGLIVSNGQAPFKFVFVSACHSGLAGETFASAGVPHVVCCRQESELKDTAALAFTRQFYLALAVGHTVRESFDQGCKAVRATPNLRDPEQEMGKFVLLPKDGNHDVPVFKAKQVREWPRPQKHHGLLPPPKSRRSLIRMRSVMGLGAKSSELSVRNMIQEDPSPTPPQFFLGREVDMYFILTAILSKRLVSILGETGMGRSSLACALCHYINERASTMSDIHRIYFVKPKHGGRNVSCRALLRQLLDKLEEAGKAPPTDEDSDTEALLDVICKSLKTDKALIVFDRTELLEKLDEAQEIPMVLDSLFSGTKHVSVLLTGKRPLGIASLGEHPYNLGPLNFANTVRLFSNLCPHLHTPSERGLLFRRLVAEYHDQMDLYPGDSKMNQRTKYVMSFMGGGVPAKIEKAAYSMSREDLQKLQDGEYLSHQPH